MASNCISDCPASSVVNLSEIGQERSCSIILTLLSFLKVLAAFSSIAGETSTTINLGDCCCRFDINLTSLPSPVPKSSILSFLLEYILGEHALLHFCVERF